MVSLPDAAEQAAAEDADIGRREAVARLACMCVAFVVSVSYTVMSLSFYHLARHAPLVAGLAASLLLAITIIRAVFEIRRSFAAGAGKTAGATRSIEYDKGMLAASLTNETLKESVIVILSFVAFVAGVMFIDIYLSAFVYLVGMLRYYAKASLLACLVYALATCGYLWVFAHMMSIAWPASIF